VKNASKAIRVADMAELWLKYDGNGKKRFPTGGEILDDALILLVEDRDDDVSIILKGFEAAKINNPVTVVRDGEEAIQYLDHKGMFTDRDKYPLPHLILLDLKMPRVDGFDVLRWVRSQQHLSGIIIVVLTSSNQIRDVNQAYQLGANSFLVKPDDFQNVTSMATLLKDYWLYGNRTPGNRPRPSSSSSSSASP